jgi:hypothetical protein
MTEEVLNKLREAFMIGCPVEEAAAWAGISTATVYNYLNSNPEYLEKVEQWQRNPVIKARNTVFENLKNPQTASWYLERKNKDEFGARTELTGAGGKPLIPPKVSKEEKDEVVARIAEEIAIIRGNKNGQPKIDGGGVPTDTNEPLGVGDGSGSAVDS